MPNDLLDFLVIIPTHKRQSALRAAIKSAVSQTGITKQIIVADDCPEASAAEVAGEFPKVIYLKNPQPSGGWPGKVRNYAFNSSCEMGIKAHYVHFLDDDDTVPEGHYDAVRRTFDRYPHIGVVFGVLRPFCAFSDNPDCRERQEQQLRGVRNWRVKVTRFPWLYQGMGDTCEFPHVTQWLYRQHAMFGSEMFLCSGGVIRHRHVLELGGFPDIRITEDYSFYTDAIRKFGARFLRRETAGYGIGDPGALWNPLDPDAVAKAANINDTTQALRFRQRKLRAGMGFLKYYALNINFRVGLVVLNRVVIPVLDRRGYFIDLYRLIDPDYFTKASTVEESPQQKATRIGVMSTPL